MYEHTQIGVLILVVLGLALLVLLVLATQVEEIGLTAMMPAIGILAVAAFLFGSLTVRIQDRQLQIRFGPGLIRRSIPLERIRDARAVKNPWLYGYGVHITPHGWLYNVSGRDGVEVTLVDGKAIRIGTDEPDRLLAALRRHLGMTRRVGQDRGAR